MIEINKLNINSNCNICNKCICNNCKNNLNSNNKYSISEYASSFAELHNRKIVNMNKTNNKSNINNNSKSNKSKDLEWLSKVDYLIDNLNTDWLNAIDTDDSEIDSD